MILDTIDNLTAYASLNPLFAEVVRFLNEHPLETLPVGRYEIVGKDLFVNIVDSPAKCREEAKIETHRRMIDIQIPISGAEEHGFTPLASLPDAEYNDDDDISFYPGEAESYYNVTPGEMVIYFPSDGHAPAITPCTLRKAIFKVRA